MVALWVMVYLTIVQITFLFLMCLKYNKINKMVNGSPDNRRSTAVYSSLLMTLVLYVIVLIGCQMGGWLGFASEWYAVWIVMVLPLLLPVSFFGLVHVTRKDFVLLETGHVDVNRSQQAELDSAMSIAPKSTRPEVYTLGAPSASHSNFIVPSPNAYPTSNYSWPQPPPALTQAQPYQAATASPPTLVYSPHGHTMSPPHALHTHPLQYTPS
ncbi:hypothetical protein DIPPA_70003 [Diplonema papillatum]|nr:hypothetical protein DIPPA_70003 [Diplonema papillatum]